MTEVTTPVGEEYRPTYNGPGVGITPGLFALSARANNHRVAAGEITRWVEIARILLTDASSPFMTSAISRGGARGPHEIARLDARRELIFRGKRNFVEWF